MKRRSSSLVCAMVALAACRHPFGQRPMVVISAAQLDVHGTKVFRAPAAKVFDAAIGALRAQGYTIAAVNPDTGLIVTGRKLVDEVAIGTAYYAQAVERTRQYRVDVQAIPSGGTLVTVRPRMFEGEMEVPAGEDWQLNGSSGVYAPWALLFDQMDELLAPSPGAASGT